MNIPENPSLRTSYAHTPEFAPSPGQTLRITNSRKKAAPLLACLAALCTLLFFSGYTWESSVQLYPAFQKNRQIIRNQYEVATVVVGRNVVVESIDWKSLDESEEDSLNRKRIGSRFVVNHRISTIDLLPGRHVFTLSYFRGENKYQEHIPPRTFTMDLQAGKFYRTRFTKIGKKKSSFLSSSSSLKIEWFFDQNLPSSFKNGVNYVRSFAPNTFPNRIIYTNPMFSIGEMSTYNDLELK
ncbi:MAG: hypothetical protein LBV54_08650 [Puniceicoccales bacterium]|jgi:hypothetical protein|nr:hypothetical protein [Puniceicoccales bacterium]